MSAIVSAALEFINAGLAVYPTSDDKKPLIKGWNNWNAIRTTERAEQYFSEHSNAQIGIACGPSGLTVVDVDPKNGGDSTFRNLVFELGYDYFEPCPQVITPSGGLHIWFRQPLRPIALRANGLGPGIDIIGCKNGVLAPPSQRTGFAYTWRDGVFPDLSVMPLFPNVLIERMTQERQSGIATVRRAAPLTNRLPDTIPEHSRNTELMRAGYRARWRFGYNEDELLVLLREINRRCQPSLEDQELRDMSRCIARKAASTVDPMLWLRSRIPDFQSKQEFRVGSALATIADFSIGLKLPGFRG